MDWNLLEKTTFWIEGAHLDGANLDHVAAEAAAALGLLAGEVMVVDVQEGMVAFDILPRHVSAESVAGTGTEMLRRLAEVPGVNLDADATIHSEGVLGLIALDPDHAKTVVAKSAEVGAAVVKAVSRRACVFASGSEVIAGNIQDTNSPYLIRTLADVGFRTEFGGIIEDSTSAAVQALDAAIMRGFGLVITTGGVGAEQKDHSVEAVLKLDPAAHTPWILRFTPDMRRHHKTGVRIALGRVGICRIIALPGPHAEVQAGCGALVEGLERGLEDGALAEAMASAIRERWLNHAGGD
jgi:molybdenum cofactor synthesis domain-containing protein